MLERIVENWLTKVNERSLEIPFCQLLAAENHQIIHLSRHGPFEQGKDILTLAPDGIPCAFQLKDEKLTAKKWEEFLPQVIRLVELPIVHPSIASSQTHRAYLVTSSELDEEVRLEIKQRNQDWQRRGHPQLEVIVKGQLLQRFQAIHTNFWPVQLTSEKSLLEFFLSDGNDCLDKGKLARFTSSILPMYEADINKAECSRSLASAAILTSYALLPYQAKSNHVAIIEGWIVYISCLVMLVEKLRLAKQYWKESLDISIIAIERAFEELIEELKKRTNLAEGDVLFDYPFYAGRTTWILGLVSAYALWNRFVNPEWIIEDWYKEFLHSNQKYLLLWGEGAVPQFLSVIWLMRAITATLEPDKLLQGLVEKICDVNINEDDVGLPDPYQDIEKILDTAMKKQHGIPDLIRPENYKGRSYVLNALIQVFVRRNKRQAMRLIWPRITHIELAEFVPDESWQLCLWNSDQYGKLHVTYPKFTQSWKEMCSEAEKSDVSQIPSIFLEHPELMLIFIICFPHRLTKNVALFLDDVFGYRTPKLAKYKS